MGEAARRRRLGFDGPALGQAVLAALDADAGGNVWELVKGTRVPEFFLRLDDTGAARPAHITNAEAASTPHRVVMQTLVRRGEAWMNVLIFDTVEEYRHEVYEALGGRALEIAHATMGEERIDEVRHQIFESTWPGGLAREMRRLEQSASPAEGSG